MTKFGGGSKGKHPKFLLNLQINELVNVPQSSGYCYVKWSFKDGTGTSRTVGLSGDSRGDYSTQSKGVTAHVPLKHHRAQWNYRLDKPVQIKLQINRDGKLCEKDLVLQIYFEAVSTPSRTDKPVAGVTGASSSSDTSSSAVSSPRKSILRTPSLRSSQSFELSNRNSVSSFSPQANGSRKNSYTQRVTGTLLLGTVTVNVAEYVRKEEEPITNRFLLKQSKVNSILSVTFQLKVIRGTYRDFKIPSDFSTGQLSSSYQNGISKIFERNSSITSGGSTTGSDLPSMAGGASGLATGATYVSSRGITTIAGHLNPLINTLHDRTFQLTWDPRPNELTPAECVENILKGGNGWAKNENGVNLIDIQALKLKDLVENSAGFVSNGPSCDSNDTAWDNMNNREFLEMKTNSAGHDWSHLSSNQRQRMRNGSQSEHEKHYEDQDERIADPIVRDAKSWTITTPVV
ncbi:uncharacterized protein KNAG_0B02220 [Huiozyma naganishii CBS 8797]|uniref:C2 NT-type domain-containing protein n=1 Tax=Huiozyma naganishii (strain ATCC MYA-139 / BCRC 22969 / CBS 8797 / KCTC 17520 / NBRC 10181 / NCYC 3082 / Yp74L-3) TaxID=1071383 RepID=J7S3D8_HUIN7|nr:hypothetical protein KNAG_0B02220 [Kazachstania naganishii CBS 8797]CCK68664.1 hypothetical protein KNAG_0B02220 [Kazachstania naganishii CBS 8797]